MCLVSCGRFGLWPFWFVAVSVCGRFSLWPFRFVAVSVCGRLGFSHFGLWPLWPEPASTSFENSSTSSTYPAVNRCGADYKITRVVYEISSVISDSPTILFYQMVWFKPTTDISRTLTAHMMTSSNGNIFRVTGPLCGELTGPRWILRTKASDTGLWYFLWSVPE